MREMREMREMRVMRVMREMSEREKSPRARSAEALTHQASERDAIGCDRGHQKTHDNGSDMDQTRMKHIAR